MNDPITFRDAVEDEVEYDPSIAYEHLDSVYRSIEVPKEDPAAAMIAEIMELNADQEAELFPWRDPVIPGGALENRYSVCRILEKDFADGHPSILARMAKEAARIIQFPENTAYLHGIGVFSSATVINFMAEYNHKHIPTGMYTLCAQPSGSGKSAVHNYFMDPISEALDKRNRILFVEHKALNVEIESINKQIDKAGNGDKNLLRNLSYELASLNEEKIRRPIVNHAVKNTTPEAAEEDASKQGGVISVCSDEQEALDSYLGIAYGDGKKSPNNGVFIAAFGGDRIGTSRVSRDGYKGQVRGAFAVMAQNASVDVMIKAGAAGRGVSERCLIIKERNMIGHRVYARERPQFDPDLLAEYNDLCENIVDADYPLRLSFSDECKDIIVDLKNQIEPQCQSGNRYGDEQIRGFASKIEQHATKLAANLHIAEQWNPRTTKKPSFVIQQHNLVKAILVCMDLLDAYKTLIERESDMSGTKLVLEVIGHMKRYAMKDVRSFTIDKLRMAVTKEAWYNAIDGKKIDFLANLLSRAEEMNFCHVKENGKDKKQWQVLINPALRTYTIPSGE